MTGKVQVGVIGVDHPHAVTLAADLTAAGAELTGWAITDDDPGGLFEACFPDAERRSPDELVASSPALAVIAAVPGDRAELAVAAMEAGSDVLVDKPGAVTLAEVDRIEAAANATGRRWWVAFTEHITSRAMMRADELVASGRIGTVRHVLGLGPHRRGHDRPPWFTDPVRAGGTITDLASHQVHHAARLLGTTDLRVVAARATARPDGAHPDLLGEIMLEGGTGSAYIRVDWLTPDGLPTWGDVRLLVVGDHGTIEVRPTIDVGGAPGGDHVVVVDAAGVERLGCGNDPLTWAQRLVADVGADTESVVTTAHGLAVTRLCLTAQALADQRPAVGD